MPLYHVRGDDRRTLATDVDFANSILAQMRGLMFERSLPPEYALVFRFDGAKDRNVHMLFVFFSLDVLWLVDGEVRRIERLEPWTGMATAKADTLVELPAGSADGVAVGDRIVVE